MGRVFRQGCGDRLTTLLFCDCDHLFPSVKWVQSL